MVKAGYNKIKVKVGVEGGTNPDEDVRRIQAVREAVGPDIGIAIDANNVWPASIAVQFANRIRDLNIIFLRNRYLPMIFRALHNSSGAPIFLWRQGNMNILNMVSGI